MKFSTILMFSALSVATTNAVDYDAAYIYSGCTLENGAFPEYATNADCQTNFGSDCEYGDGWYCNDGTDVSKIDSKDFDDSAIHAGCDTGVHFSLSYSKWYCKDDGPEGDVDSNSFIAKGCNDPDFPKYAKNADCQTDWGKDCVFGDGWYCSDGTDVSSYDYTFDFDDSFIHSNCNDCDTDGKCAKWRDDLVAWVCNDSQL